MEDDKLEVVVLGKRETGYLRGGAVLVYTIWRLCPKIPFKQLVAQIADFADQEDLLVVFFNWGSRYYLWTHAYGAVEAHDEVRGFTPFRYGMPLLD